MWTIPNTAIVTSGAGTGSTPLNAFDKALLNAGIGNFNLIKVSSVLPPLANVYSLSELNELQLPAPGQIVPCVYNSFFGDIPGTVISSAIAVAKPLSGKHNGMIFESGNMVDEDTIRKLVSEMVTESMDVREYGLSEIVLCSTSLRVEKQIGCVIAAVLLCNLEVV